MKTIDAQNRTIGRVATEAAMGLMGKNKPDYEPNKKPTEKVEIINASKAKISIKKLEEKIYKRYTGYPSGLKERTLQELITKKGYREVFEKAVRGMLPNNKLRAIMLKNLTIKD
jgi:large subunit ribosomal protein L13